MNCGQATRMAGIKSLEKIKCFTAADLAEYDAVGAMPECRANQMTNSDRRQVRLFPARFEAHQIRFFKLDFGGVLDQHDPLDLRDECPYGVQQRGLACSRSTADENVVP